MRPKLERVQYPAVRELSLCTPTAETPSPNFWSLSHDAGSWVRQGKGFSMHKNERTYTEAPKPASATDFYNTDQSSKMSLAHRVQRSPYRYVSMRSQSAGREGDSAYLGSFFGTTERVGPGAYAVGMGAYVPTAGGRATYREMNMPRSEPASSAFASGMPRSGGIHGFGVLRGRTAEPGYATLKTDLAVWNKHANAQGKGYSFDKTQRFARPPGPGSNRPLEKLTPGPGSYGRLHSWPEKGFPGTARGYNHNAAVG